MAKKLRYRIDTSNVIGVKSTLTQRINTEKVKRVTIDIGVDSDYQVVPEYAFVSSILTRVTKETDQKTKYYKMGDINYLCTMTVKLRGEKVLQTDVVLYLPLVMLSTTEMLCERIKDVKKEQKEKIIQGLLPYVLGRTKG